MRMVVLLCLFALAFVAGCRKDIHEANVPSHPASADVHEARVCLS